MINPSCSLRLTALRCVRAALRGVCVTIASAAIVSPAFAQSALSAGEQNATRQELTERLAALERQVSGGQLRGDARSRATLELSAIRNRLSMGDFRVGDRFILYIRQETMKADTVSVRDSLLVSVAALPDVSVSGVLRSELSQRMNAHVARFLRNSEVRSSVLTRVSVRGAVGNPGIYYIEPDRPVTDILMMAGGPASADAQIDRIEVTRGAVKILSAKASTRAVKEGRTLAQLDIQSGDELRVPVKRKVNWSVIIQSAFLFMSLFFALLQFLQWYYSRQDA